MAMKPSIPFHFEVHTGDGTDVDVEIDMVHGPIVYQVGLAPAFSTPPSEASIDSAGGMLIKDVRLDGGKLTLTLERPARRPFIKDIERNEDGTPRLDDQTGQPVPIIETPPPWETPLPSDAYITVTGRARF